MLLVYRYGQVLFRAGRCDEFGNCGTDASFEYYPIEGDVHPEVGIDFELYVDDESGILMTPLTVDRSARRVEATVKMESYVDAKTVGEYFADLQAMERDIEESIIELGLHLRAKRAPKFGVTSRDAATVDTKLRRLTCTDEQLVDLYVTHGKSMSEIASDHGVSKTAVFKHLDRLGVR